MSDFKDFFYKRRRGATSEDKEGSPSGTAHPYELLIKPPFPQGVDPTKREVNCSFRETWLLTRDFLAIFELR